MQGPKKSAERAQHSSPAASRPESESGVPLDLVYSSEHLVGWSEHGDLGRPGDYPFVRGIYPTMYRGRLWTFRQYGGFGTADDTNARFRYLLEQGQTGLSVALDLPTQLGYDSDNANVEEEVGRVGVAIDTLADMERLFAGIDLSSVSTHFTINATAPIILAMYLAVAEGQGVSPQAVRGTVQNDILKEYAARKAYIFPPRPSLRLAIDIIEYCAHQAPAMHPISIAGFHMREAGATPLQELAFTIADGLAYVQAIQDRGMNIDAVSPRLSFHFSCGQDLFEEVAKFRAARRMWARLMRDRFGAKDPRSCMLRFFSGGSGASLAWQEPRNNIIRSTIQCLAAVLGGAQAIHVMSYDEAHTIPSEEAVRLSLRTHQILAEESGAARVVDPLGGSYFVEFLTDEMERRALAIIEEIENRGGMVDAIERGDIQRAILDSAVEREMAVLEGRRVQVGNDRDAEPDSRSHAEEIEIQEPPAEVLPRQRALLAKTKGHRDDGRVWQALASVAAAAKTDSNIMSPVLDAVKAYATVGEITEVLVDAYGRHRDSQALGYR